tara:strand:+ start:304 stop:588 length:285 start_codon:yes stop_codon:yes gene_type:complete
MKLRSLVHFLKCWKKIGVLNNLDFEYDNIVISGFQTKDLMSPCLLVNMDVDTMKCDEVWVDGDAKDRLFFSVSAEFENRFRSLQPKDFEYKVVN